MKPPSHTTRAKETAMEYAKVPENMQAGPNCYAVTVNGDSLIPEYRNGDVVICDPDQEPIIGDIVMVWWKGGKGVADMVRLVTAPPPCDIWNDCESF
ncbi:MAG: S24 family peptidase [Pseudomonadota bacterium]